MCTPTAAAGLLLSLGGMALDQRENSRVEKQRKAAIAEGENARLKTQQEISRNLSEVIPEYTAEATQADIGRETEDITRESTQALDRARADRVDDPTGGQVSGAYRDKVLRDLIDEATRSANDAKLAAAVRAPAVVQQARAAGLNRLNDRAYTLNDQALGTTAAANIKASAVQKRPSWLGAIASGAGSSLMSGGLGESFASAKPSTGTGRPPLGYTYGQGL